MEEWRNARRKATPRAMAANDGGSGIMEDDAHPRRDTARWRGGSPYASDTCVMVTTTGGMPRRWRKRPQAHAMAAWHCGRQRTQCTRGHGGAAASCAFNARWRTQEGGAAPAPRTMMHDAHTHPWFMQGNVHVTHGVRRTPVLVDFIFFELRHPLKEITSDP